MGLLSLEKQEVEHRIHAHVVNPPEVVLDPFSEVLDEVRTRAADL